MSETRCDWAAFDWAAAIWFGASCLILLASLLLTVGEGRQVQIAGFTTSLPETCSLYARLGINCPGCGLTRSVIHLAHGRLGDAWQVQPMGIVVFCYILMQLPLSFAYWNRRTLSPVQLGFLSRWIWFNERGLLVIAVLLALRWVWLLFSGDLS